MAEPRKVPDSLNAATWLAQVTVLLKSAGISTARLDAFVLLEDITGKSRAWLLAHDEFELSNEQLKQLNEKIKRRAIHEPLAYIREQCEFYGRQFSLNNHTLVPRPESETIIDILCKLPLPSKISVADIGTGSGALGITAGLELSNITKLDLYDIDAAALKIAKLNAHKHRLKVRLYEGDLLEADHDSYNVIIANLPYVPDNYTINKAALFEPVMAIFGGSDGLDIYRRLFEQLSHKTWCPEYVITESLPFQHETMCEIARSCGFSLKLSDDFIQLFEATVEERLLA